MVLAVVQYLKDAIPKRYTGDKVDQKEVLVVQYLKAVGSNPMHVGLRIQQLVHTEQRCQVQHLKKKIPKIQRTTVTRKEFFFRARKSYW